MSSVPLLIPTPQRAISFSGMLTFAWPKQFYNPFHSLSNQPTPLLNSSHRQMAHASTRCPLLHLQALSPFFLNVTVTRTRLALSTCEQSLTSVKAPTSPFLSHPFLTLSKHYCLGDGDLSALFPYQWAPAAAYSISWCLPWECLVTQDTARHIQTNDLQSAPSFLPAGRTD